MVPEESPIVTQEALRVSMSTPITYLAPLIVTEPSSKSPLCNLFSHREALKVTQH